MCTTFITIVTNIIVELKLEHQLVLESIEKALRLVDKSNPTTTTNMNNNYNNNNNSNNNTNIGTQMYSSPTRLFDKITSVINSPSSTPKRRVLLPSNNTTANTTTNSSPLSPALEKSYITFDILNDLENHQSQGTPTDRNGNKLFNHHSTETEHRRSPHSRSVHFSNTDTHQSTDLSMASQEYLKKYGLI